MVRKILQVRGIVQGVGFRPFVYKKALQYSLNGRVMNNSSGVVIDIEGSAPQLEAFVRELLHNPPPLSKITELEVENVDIIGFKDFEILTSQASTTREAMVPPDVALCPDCKRDIFNQKDRHYLYPFTNCTNCGPRFTIVKDIPYDRAQTTMQDFKMCPECEKEYTDPLNRRFHAQPVACPNCGPHIYLVDNKGASVTLAEGNPYLTFRNLLKAGKIIGVKSLGGFHLACNAKDERAINTLRQRKNRPAKPFAVMAKDIAIIKEYCHLSLEEEKALKSPSAPIVILDRFKNLPHNLAPNISTLGVMVPYTPLHFLLFDEEIDFLVMTSANLSNLPLVKDNEEALRQLGGIADYFLLHNRDIFNRCDDSLVRIRDGKLVFWRRSRGAVPEAIKVPEISTLQAKESAASLPAEGQTKEDLITEKLVVLGTGSEMKNTFCLLRGASAFMSQHIGELDSLEGIENYRESLGNFKKLIDVEPKILGYDFHPGYQITRIAQELPLAKKFAIQHHHAHMAACMAENNLEEDVIGVILDGTGYGLDNNLWGFEIFTGNYHGFQRQGHLAYVPLPGGERAIKNPWITAVSYLMTNFATGKDIALKLFPTKKAELQLISKMIADNINSPLSSGCGRLFDAVSALLGACSVSTYEGQAAIELGELIQQGIRGSYIFGLKEGSLEEPFLLDPTNIFEEILKDLEEGISKGEIATKFHNTVVEMVTLGVKGVACKTNLKKVVLSGGTWQNEYLTQRTLQVLESAGFRVYTHSKVPTNDGGLALGQAMIAYRRWHKDVFGSSS